MGAGLGALFDKRFGKKCAFVVGPIIGFAPVTGSYCLGHRGVWALDATGAKLIEVPPA